MINLEIDGKKIDVSTGSTILEAANMLGIHIPTLCFSEKYDHHTSCMVCMVKDKRTGNILPACSTQVEAGMIIESDTDDIKKVRRETLEFLLSEHSGDCEAPCTLACPAHINIPLMIEQIRISKLEEALKTVLDSVPFPSILGRLCPTPCERVCRRGVYDDPVSICLLKQYVGDKGLEKRLLVNSGRKSFLKEKVAIIGAGPAGLSASYYLSLEGYRCTIYEKQGFPGGKLRVSIKSGRLPLGIFEQEIDIIRKMGVHFEMNTVLGKDISLKELEADYDAVILAIGDLAQNEIVLSDIKIDNNRIYINKNFETSKKGVFACGAAVKHMKMAVKAMAEGKSAAEYTKRHIMGKVYGDNSKLFYSRFGKLSKDEIEGLLEDAQFVSRTKPVSGDTVGFIVGEAEREASRCIQCQCLKADKCKLRLYAMVYKAKQPKLWINKRKNVKRIKSHPGIIYEPSKCIKCGLCIRISQTEQEDTGFCFIGRGFNVEVGIPFNEQLKYAIKHTGGKCVELCPTGALVNKNNLILKRWRE